MANVSRLKLDHPALGTAGGAGLHASVEALYVKLGDSINSRWFSLADFDQGETVDLEHNFEMDIGLLRWDLWNYTGGEWVKITADSSPALSAFSIVEKTSFEDTVLQITNNTGGDNLTFAVSISNDPIYLAEGDIEDIDITTVAPEEGQALVWDSATKKFKPGASGDASFKLQAISDPTATIKGGYILLDDGRELATYDGAGTASTDFGKDLSINLDTVLGGNPANATVYYQYIDLASLSAPVTQSDTGRKVYAVTVSNFVLLTTPPDLTDLTRYIPRHVIKSATTGTVWSGSGAGFATLGFLSGQTVDAQVKNLAALNFIDVPTPDKNIGSAIVYADAAAATPADGTGGSANVTFARNTTSPIRGIADYKFVKDASNRQGQGFSIPFSIPDTDKSTKARIKFRYNASHANYAAGDLVVYVYDVTNSVLITPAVVALPKLTGVFETSFDLTQGSSYRLIGHVATTNASAYDVYFDDFRVDTEKQGAANSVSVEYAYNTNTADSADTTSFANGPTGVVIGSFSVGRKKRVRFPTAAQDGDTHVLQFREGTTGPWVDLGQFTKINTDTICSLEFQSANSYGVALAPVSGSSTDLDVVFGNYAQIAGASFGSNGSPWSSYTAIYWRVKRESNNLSNIGNADVEYASNSSTADANDTTSFAYGDTGSVVPGTLTSDRTKLVRFRTPIQTGDRIELEYNSGGNLWVPMSLNLYQNIVGPFQYQNGVGYGIGFSNAIIGTTDVNVAFGRYYGPTGATYGAAGGNWSALAGQRWRVKRTRGGAAVGFGAATATSMGLVKGGEVPGSSSGSAIAEGNIGHNQTFTGSVFSSNSSTPVVVKSFPGLKKGMYMFSCSLSHSAGTSVAAEFRFRKVTGSVLVRNQYLNISSSLSLAFNWSFPFYVDADQDYELTVHNSSGGGTITIDGNGVNQTGTVNAGQYYDITRIG